MTPGFVGRFVGRRLVRLGPPYYAALVLGIVVHASWFADSLHTTLPSFQSWKGVAINALYLHDLLGYRSPFGTVAWTLCLELQFYIVLVVGTGVSQGVGAWFSSPAGYFVRPAIVSRRQSSRPFGLLRRRARRSKSGRAA